jgi:hypothetical protein
LRAASGDEGACAQLLTVWNDSSNTLAFKIKSNAPRRFFVRPNNGVLPPGRTLEVDVSLQPASAEHLTAIVPLGSPLGGSVAMSNAFDGTTYKFIVLSVRIDARCAMDEGSLATLVCARTRARFGGTHAAATRRENDRRARARTSVER